MKARTQEIGTAIAQELGEIEKRLLELTEDARSIRFHRATERLSRMHYLAQSVRWGITQQLGKLKGRG
jgi:hypothetical protein